MHTLSPHLLLITTAILSLCFFSPLVRSIDNPPDLRDFLNRNISIPPAKEVGESDGDEFRLCSRVNSNNSCPVKCFIADPVCGNDGVTYWCGCADAACGGTGVANRGFCPIGDVASGPVTGQALLLVHIVWLILVAVFVMIGIM